MDIKLIRPAEKYAGQVMDFKMALMENNEGFDGCAGLEDVESFEEWLDFEGRLKKKFGGGYVPSDVFLAVRGNDDRVVGIIDLRRELTDFLLRYGGNIGYSVLPLERRKGYGGEMLRLILEYCREIGKEKVLLTCDGKNEGSRRVIMKNGGILENTVHDDVGLCNGGIIERYWIVL